MMRDLETTAVAERGEGKETGEKRAEQGAELHSQVIGSHPEDPGD